MAELPKSKSTGGCYYTEWAPCTSIFDLLIVAFVKFKNLNKIAAGVGRQSLLVVSQTARTEFTESSLNSAGE